MQQQSYKRLESLDVLRGLDIFLLVCLQPLFYWLLTHSCATDNSFAAALKYQLEHCSWEGFRFWDIIMPLFLFMAGAAIPFSLRKYDTSLKFYVRIFRRVLLLFILGMAVQGGLLSLDLHKFRFYSNTLQAIGIGYLITSVVFLNFKTRGRIISAVVIFAAYWALLTFFGDFSPDGNFAEKVDNLMLGRWRDGVYWKGESWFFGADYHYTWLVSSLNFGITVMLGAFAGSIMIGENKIRNARNLAILVAALIVGGLLLSLQMPIIKKIWSSSMTLYSGGLCMSAMALFYYLIDCRGKLRWLYWLKIYGMNSIFAYVVSMIVNFRSIPMSVFYGLKPYLIFGGTDYYPFLMNMSQYAIIFAILFVLSRNKIFLKV